MSALAPPSVPRDVEHLCDLIGRLRAASAPGQRTIVGVVGEPGAGKSTLVEELVEALGTDAAPAPMDGFHLSNKVLDDLGLRVRKGAPETFDAHGFVQLLERLRDQREDVVYAPEFLREHDESIAGRIAITRDTPVVLVEGNYLLLEQPPWLEVRRHLDAVWYLDLDHDERLRRLAERHRSFGRAEEHAWERARTHDQVNAELVRRTRVRADLVVRADGGHGLVPSPG
ncbi:nucleoside/nucleotide kinase family protein [Phycicoccus sp. M110.8]|uniref:nucleoside/nucleotide kinase family protein n=1 Tax=Phycicoccus sp. M110.8 TaxID=3075433 RepID=UPI0028FD28A1|nr:nucleoside/nucleotide kinase family protein [Phycicoccus sp. M110.8]MDU0315034.1 nucleoside/nucleotide kinase family protein [Phycicoccus sp. M110.8]